MNTSLSRYDMHFHLEAATNRPEVLACAAAAGTGLLCMTVTPENYQRDKDLVQAAPNARIGLGLHRWWAEEGPAGERRLGLFEELLAEADLVGEVGLDYGKAHVGTAGAQRRVLQRVARACAPGGKTLSLHAVHAAKDVLDILDSTGCLESCTCIFHWYSDDNESLTRAVRRGCYFSVGEPMLRTKRGRAYVRAIPANRLLLETDLPAWNVPFDEAELERSLDRTEEQLATLLGKDRCLQAREASERVFNALSSA